MGQSSGGFYMESTTKTVRTRRFGILHSNLQISFLMALNSREVVGRTIFKKIAGYPGTRVLRYPARKRVPGYPVVKMAFPGRYGRVRAPKYCGDPFRAGSPCIGALYMIPVQDKFSNSPGTAAVLVFLDCLQALIKTGQATFTSTKPATLSLNTSYQKPKVTFCIT